jgi:VanZ family protein
MSKKALFFSLYLLIIILMILLPINSKESSLNNNYVLYIRADYLGHSFLFLPWMWLKPFNTRKLFILVWLIGGVVFAGITEGIQYFLPYRSFNVNDLFANFAGLIFSCLSIVIFQKN